MILYTSILYDWLVVLKIVFKPGITSKYIYLEANVFNTSSIIILFWVLERRHRENPFHELSILKNEDKGIKLRKCDLQLYFLYIIFWKIVKNLCFIRLKSANIFRKILLFHTSQSFDKRQGDLEPFLFCNYVIEIYFMPFQ